jgi:hypothetical protein
MEEAMTALEARAKLRQLRQKECVEPTHGFVADLFAVADALSDDLAAVSDQVAKMIDPALIEAGVLVLRRRDGLGVISLRTGESSESCLVKDVPAAWAEHVARITAHLHGRQTCHKTT